jgi:hypothetical protein
LLTEVGSDRVNPRPYLLDAVAEAAFIPGRCRVGEER